MMEKKKLRVGTIGAGWCGLYALKWLLEEEQVGEVVTYEETDRIGGVWVYDENVSGGVAKTTHSTSSKSYMHACDYPMPEDLPHFPHHSQVLEYIRDYAQHFDLVRHVRFRHEVVRVEKEGERWRMDVVNRAPGADATPQTEYFDRVVIAAGLPTEPVMPDLTVAPWSHFSGPITHSADYKCPTPDMEGQRILLVGIGETASDMAVDLAKVAKSITISSRSGVWIHDRDLCGAVPADVLGNRAVWAPGYFTSSLVACAQFILEFLWGWGGSGVPDWYPRDKPYMRSFLNKSRDLMREITKGNVIPRGAVTRVEGSKVWFAGREAEGPQEFDRVIWCCGFKPRQSFFREPVCFTSLYQYIFKPDDPTMAFVGTARPIFGSFPGCGEMQARCVAAVFGGRAVLPSCDDMCRLVVEMNEEHARVFPGDAARGTMVNHFEYTDRIAEMFDAKPHLLREYVRNPITWWRLVYQVWTPFQFLLNDPSRREAALNNLVNEYPPNHKMFDLTYYSILFHVLLFHAFVLLALGFVFYKSVSWIL